jgi:hypothetical protein
LSKQHSKSAKTPENIEQIALNYDLNRSFSLLETKIDYFTEANVLLSEKIKKQKKNVDDTKNLLITNNTYRNKSSSLIKSNLGDSSSSKLTVDKSSTSLSSSSTTSNISDNKVQTFAEPKNNIQTSFLPATISDISGMPKQSIAQGVIHPISLNSNNSKLLEPMRRSLHHTMSENKTNNSDNDSNNNSTGKDATNFKNNKDFFNSFESSSLDPFNDMELKTINDLEELKTILQNHQTSQQEAQKQTSNTFKSIEFQPQSQTHQVTHDGSLSSSLLNPTNLKLIQTNNFLVDNFGLPKISFVDLDINSNKL